MKFSEELAVQPGHKVKLSKWDPDDTRGFEKDPEMKDSLEKAIKRLVGFQYRLYAEKKRALLLIFQGIDAAGKDGTIRHVMSGVDPQGCVVKSFKVPSAEEAAHDFLWRVHKAIPGYGEIGVFNRSHYEDVLIVRVHELVSRDVWSRRYDQINEFETMLEENKVRILKFFLHISKDEQRKRFLERIEDPDKRWKISEDDFKERKYWHDYTAAYEDALEACSTKKAPWFIIPANKKWFRNLAVSHIIDETFREMDIKFPPPTINLKKLKWK
ncbi:MAG TPA: polyphosphate kinase 2 family protein [Candidatus Binatus sp.]|nr:polyphosphate kinase 2 family protein [Candidatus Binatus sp.]